jgi:hypothetical protein
MDEPSIARRFDVGKNKGVKKFAIACDVAGLTFQVTLDGVYYTP